MPKVKKITAKEAIEDIYTGYGLKTLVSGWNFSSESYPRDTIDTVHDQALSTYKRLGTGNLPTPKSVTRHDQEFALSLPKPKITYRPMGNIDSYQSLFEGKRSSLTEKVMASYPEDFEQTNYLTTNQVFFRIYGGSSPNKAVLKAEDYKPETKHRRLLTDPSSIKRPNLGTFMDENMEYLSAMRKSASGPPPYALHC